MTNDELRTLIESNARAITATNESIAATNEGISGLRTQQETNTANITDLVTVAGNVLRAVDGLVAKINESNERFEILRQEAIADRQRSDERFERILREIRSTNQRVDRLEAG